MQEFKQGNSPEMGFLGIGHRLQPYKLGPRVGQQFAKRCIVNQADVKIAAAMCNERLNAEVDIWLVEVARISRLETLPFPGVDLVAGVNPEFRSAAQFGPVSRACTCFAVSPIQQIFLNEAAVFVMVGQVHQPSNRASEKTDDKQKYNNKPDG